MPETDDISPRRIFLVDAAGIVREGVACLINRESDFTVCGQADSVSSGIAAILEAKPDCVLMDIVLKQGSGMDMIAQLKALLPSTAILVLSMCDETIFAERVLEAGASGYVGKDDSSAKVIEALRRVIGGGLFLSDSMASRLAQQRFGRTQKSGNRLDQLSSREFQVFQLLGRWKSTREIAGELNLSVKTVEHYRETIKKKLLITNASDLVKFATTWTAEADNGPME